MELDERKKQVSINISTSVLLLGIIFLIVGVAAGVLAAVSAIASQNKHYDSKCGDPSYAQIGLKCKDLFWEEMQRTTILLSSVFAAVFTASGILFVLFYERKITVVMRGESFEIKYCKGFWGKRKARTITGKTKRIVFNTPWNMQLYSLLAGVHIDGIEFELESGKKETISFPHQTSYSLSPTILAYNNYTLSESDVKAISKLFKIPCRIRETWRKNDS